MNRIFGCCDHFEKWKNIIHECTEKEGVEYSNKIFAGIFSTNDQMHSLSEREMEKVKTFLVLPDMSIDRSNRTD